MFTSLQGYIIADYDTLVKTFGQPTIGPDTPSADDKTTCEWNLTLGGETVNIYDWKEYTGVTPRGTYEWHIGGRSRAAVEAAEKALAVGNTGPLSQYTNKELERLREAAALLADFADDTERDEFEDMYSLGMEFENELRERKVPGY